MRLSSRVELSSGRCVRRGLLHAGGLRTTGGQEQCDEELDGVRNPALGGSHGAIMAEQLERRNMKVRPLIT